MSGDGGLRFEMWQYGGQNRAGYCPDHSTGVSCPVGLGVSASTLEAVRESA